MRAKARLDRWEEELILVQNEMDWTVQWYAHQESTWLARLGTPTSQASPGHRAYAFKQISMWAWLGRQAQEQFEASRSNSTQQLVGAELSAGRLDTDP